LLNDKEIKALKSEAKTLEERVFIIIPIYSGMRIGELLHMRKEWIDWSREMIVIPETQKCDCYDCAIPKKGKHTKKEIGVWSPKTTQGVRPIPILPTIFPDLKQILEEVFKEHNSIMELCKNRAEVHYIINRVAERANIKRKLFPHLFRGTYAKQLAKAGLDAFHIKDAMGWASIEVAGSYVKMAGEEIKSEMLKKMKPF
jgi:integrase